MTRHCTTIAAIVMLLAFGGCSGPNYEVNEEMKAPLNPRQLCIVGRVADDMPADVSPDDRPTVDQLESFRSDLVGELARSRLFDVVSTDSTLRPYPEGQRYMVTARVVGYRRGTGFVRYLLGLFSKNTQVTVRFTVIEDPTSEVVCDLILKEDIGDWSTTGEPTFAKTAKDIAAALHEQAQRFAKRH